MGTAELRPLIHFEALACVVETGDSNGTQGTRLRH